MPPAVLAPSAGIPVCCGTPAQTHCPPSPCRCCGGWALGQPGTKLPTCSCFHSVPRQMGMPRGHGSYRHWPSTAAIPQAEGHQ